MTDRGVVGVRSVVSGAGREERQRSSVRGFVEQPRARGDAGEDVGDVVDNRSTPLPPRQGTIRSPLTTASIS